jgi:hypothetical protein
MTPRQLPPNARWITLASGAKRVELVFDTGEGPATGQRRQARRRVRTVDEANEVWQSIHTDVAEDRPVVRSSVTVEQACADWLGFDGRVPPETIPTERLVHNSDRGVDAEWPKWSTVGTPSTT